VAGYYIVQAATSITIDENELYAIQQVKDGDTFTAMVGHHEITVRMLGIDTPETVDPRKPEQCYGKEASNKTKELLTGKMVRLKLNPDREEKDKYGRYLAFVYSGEVFLNEFLLEEGYAREYTFGKPYMFQKEFREVEGMAKEAKRGLWGVCE
jgi:micrococcal nuclease